MKTITLPTLSCLMLMSLLVTSCGVSSDQYASAISERDAAKAQFSTANNELEKTKGELALAKSQLQTATAERDKSNSDLESANTKLQSSGTQVTQASSKIAQLQQSMTKAKILAEIISELFVPYMKGQELTPTQETALGLSFIAKIATSGDPELQRLFDAWVDSGAADRQATDLFVYIFETLPQLLKDIGSTY